MTTNETSRQLVPLPPPTLNKTSQALAIRRGEADAADFVVHLDIDDVRRLAEAIKGTRHGPRDSLLIRTLFDGCLRASEALGLRPCDLKQTNEGWIVLVAGKGNRPGIAAISPSLAAELQAYAYREQISPGTRFFPVSRCRVHQIITRAFGASGVHHPARDRDHVGAVHILRHSGAIERLRLTGNPRAVQHQLRHKSAAMTMRYLKTLSVEEGVRAQQAVDYRW